MSHYSNIPLVRLVIPLIAGIVIFIKMEHQLNVITIGVLLIIILMTGFINRFFLQRHYHLRWVFGFNVMLALILAGYLLAQFQDQKTKPQHFGNIEIENSLIRLRISEPVSEKTNSYQVVGKVTHIMTDSLVIETKGGILLYLEKDSDAVNLKYGDVILLSNNIQEIQPPKNPDAFNYKKFLSRQGIYHQAYRRTGNWHKSDSWDGNILIASAHKLREKALNALQKNNISGREFSVVSALLLGYREYLDEDLQREFAGAGAMHILCVSGLHVGIIFFALSLIFGFLDKISRGRVIKLFLIVLLIWFYAAITGFSPSVLRASTMFSFVAIGQSFRRSTNIYNTLAASAVFLILLDPLIITRIGFQLSYIAVLSIVSLQPILYRQLHFRNKIASYIWAIVTVSLAAQIGTGPLALHYFNQFPNYFLLTNLIVIPLAWLIINTGILFFIFSPVPILSEFLGKILSMFVYFLHTSVRFVEAIPGSVSHDVFVSSVEAVLILAFISIFIVFLITSGKKMVFAGLTVLLLMTISISSRTINNFKQDLIVIYHVPNTTAVDIISGKNCYFLGCEKALENPRSIKYNLHGHRVKSGTSKNIEFFGYDPLVYNRLDSDRIAIRGPLIRQRDKTVKILNTDFNSEAEYSFPDTLDLLIVTNNVKASVGCINKTFPSKRIVIDSSVGYRKATVWLNECDSLGLNCWSVRHHGAFQLAIK
jgi:competence protein ComEC